MSSRLVRGGTTSSRAVKAEPAAKSRNKQFLVTQNILLVNYMHNSGENLRINYAVRQALPILCREG